MQIDRGPPTGLADWDRRSGRGDVTWSLRNTDWSLPVSEGWGRRKRIRRKSSLKAERQMNWNNDADINGDKTK